MATLCAEISILGFATQIPRIAVGADHPVPVCFAIRPARNGSPITWARPAAMLARA